MFDLRYPFFTGSDGSTLYSETYDKLFRDILVETEKEVQLRDIDIINWDQFLIRNYSSPKYSILLLLYNNVRQSELKVGFSIKLPSKIDLDKIFDRSS